MVQSTLMGWLNDIHRLTAGHVPRTLGDAGFSAEDLEDICRPGEDAVLAADESVVRRIVVHALDGRPVVFDTD
jgi:hypothetical protein